MNAIFIFLSIVFLFLIVFGGTILGRVAMDFRAHLRERNSDHLIS